jgi:hypothetical protein
MTAMASGWWVDTGMVDTMDTMDTGMVATDDEQPQSTEAAAVSAVLHRVLLLCRAGAAGRGQQGQGNEGCLEVSSHTLARAMAELGLMGDEDGEAEAAGRAAFLVHPAALLPL